MTTKNMLRVATPDTAHAVDVESVVGLRVRVEFQEIERGNLIIELQLGDETRHSLHPSRLASVVDKAVANVDVLSSWKGSNTPVSTPRYCPDVLGVGFEQLPHVAQRALDDGLPTAHWNPSDSAWHLAVPSVCSGLAVVGMSHRGGYSHRFSAHEAAVLMSGLVS